MRKKHTFLLTVFPSEEQQPGMHGRLQFIPTGASCTFTNLDELQLLIENEIQTGEPTGIRDAKPAYAINKSMQTDHWEEEV